MADPPLLTATGLSKHYGTLQVVKGVSLSIMAGEYVAVTGPSGAGKSTLLHLLGALDVPDAGAVHILGTSVFKLSGKKQAAFRNKHLGFVFQFHHLLPEFSAVENAAMPLWIAGQSKKEGIANATTLLERVGLGARLGHKPAELSGGEQQRVAIARALVTKPSILMADEPTGNLDSANADAVHALFSELRKETGQTIILITHNQALAAATDRVVIMRDGKVVEG